jgi:putative transposase
MKYVTFLLKKQGKYLELQLIHLLIGLKQVKSILLKLHPESDCMIITIYKQLLVTIMLLNKKRKSPTVVLVPKSKWMTLDDKRIFLEKTTLITSWLQTLALGLIGKEKALKPFWNNQCLEISKKLWLPTEIDYVDSDLNYLNGYWKKTKLNSLCWIETLNNQHHKNSQTISYPLSMSTPVEKWEKDAIRAKKIRIYPNNEQKQIFRKWLGTTRYVYNKALCSIKKQEISFNFQKLRNKFVTKKNNPDVLDWMTETPKDVRAGAMKDLEIAYKAAITNLKRNNIKHFKLNYRSKKKETGLTIPSSAIKFDTEKKSLFIYKRFITTPIKISNDKLLKSINIKCDCKLKIENNKWFLCIPVEYKLDMINNDNKKECCALDPGTRKFQTIYSQEEVIKLKIEKNDKIIRLTNKIKILQSLYSRKLIKKNSFIKRYQTYNFKIKNLIDDLHFKTIKYLTDNYKTIIIPIFESQEIVKINKSKKFRSTLLSLQHFTFRQRLLDKSKISKCDVIVCTEEYTSKTCGNCGNIKNNLGNKEIYNCDKCGISIDRDINGARNILIKQLKH